MGLVRLFHGGWPHLKTVGSLVDLARTVPVDQLMARMIHHFHEIESLQEVDDDAAMVRQLVMVGVLISRAIFELHHIEPRRSSVIDAPLLHPITKVAAD